MGKQFQITKDSLIIEKKSGKYSCPHYVPPSAMDELFNDLNISADFETKKMLAEVAENFAVEIIKKNNSKTISKDRIIDIVENISLI